MFERTINRIRQCYCTVRGHDWVPIEEPQPTLDGAVYTQEQKCRTCGEWKLVGGFEVNND